MSRADRALCLVCGYPKALTKPCAHCAERLDQIRRDAASKSKPKGGKRK